MKTVNVESLAGRCAPSSDFVSNRWLAIQTDPLLTRELESVKSDSWFRWQFNAVGQNHQPSTIAPDKDISKCDCTFLGLAFRRSSLGDLHAGQDRRVAKDIHFQFFATQGNNFNRKRSDAFQECSLIGFGAEVRSINKLVRQHWLERGCVFALNGRHDVALELQDFGSEICAGVTLISHKYLEPGSD